MEAMDSIPPQIPGYTFAQKLGSGSEANVYLYQQLSPSRQVAIKVSKGMLDPRAAARFRSEANFMGKISSHPYILSVYESGVTATGNGYTVFEYAPGGNYKTFLESNRLNADQMLTVGINLASALSTAHREGIIHRDIKPSNILINTQHAHAFRFRHRENDLRTPRHRLHHRVGSAGSACEERRRQRILRHLFSGGDAVCHADGPVAVRIRLFRSSWRNPRQRTRHSTEEHHSHQSATQAQQSGCSSTSGADPAQGVE